MKQKGVVAVHPHGDTGKVDVFVSSADALSQKALEKVLEEGRFALKKMQRVDA